MTHREKHARRFEPKLVRRSQDPVTGEMVNVVLDDVQTTFDRVTNFLESECLKLGREKAARLKDKLAGRLALMYNHTDSDLDRAEWAALVMVLSRRLQICSELLTRCAERKGTK